MEQKRWEYRTVKLDDESWVQRVIDFEALDAKLNQIGQEGWELVNVIYVKESDWRTDSVIAFLKRPRF